MFSLLKHIKKYENYILLNILFQNCNNFKAKKKALPPTPNRQFFLVELGHREHQYIFLHGILGLVHSF